MEAPPLFTAIFSTASEEVIYYFHVFHALNFAVVRNSCDVWKVTAQNCGYRLVQVLDFASVAVDADEFEQGIVDFVDWDLLSNWLFLEIVQFVIIRF